MKALSMFALAIGLVSPAWSEGDNVPPKPLPIEDIVDLCLKAANGWEMAKELPDTDYAGAFGDARYNPDKGDRLYNFRPVNDQIRFSVDEDQDRCAFDSFRPNGPEQRDATLKKVLENNEFKELQSRISGSGNSRRDVYCRPEGWFGNGAMVIVDSSLATENEGKLNLRFSAQTQLGECPEPPSN